MAISTDSRVPDGASQHRISSGLLSLFFAADCHQNCSFCALKSYQRTGDGGREELDTFMRRARVARAHGVDHVQLEGIDPIRFSQILALLEELVALGFSRMTVMGTGRRFSDSSFRDSFLERAPAATTIIVPLYGVTPDVHDAVTGAPGSFSEVLSAITGLLEHSSAATLALTTVPTRQNAQQITRILSFGIERGLPVWGRLPYPLREAGVRAFRGVALREGELIDIFARSVSEVPDHLREEVARSFVELLAHPCLLYRVGEQPLGTLLRTAPQDGWSWRLEGAESGGEQSIATVPCPHETNCGLASRCPARHYRAYADLFGLDEFVPPSSQEGG